MKALLCSACVDIRALEPHGQWTRCRCGACEARWEDPARGTVRVRAVDRNLPRILGLNNNFLIKGMRGLGSHDEECAGGRLEAWRDLHDKATDAPGYIFDKAFRGCWACIIKVGETGDVRWEEEPTSLKSPPALTEEDIVGARANITVKNPLENK